MCASVRRWSAFLFVVLFIGSASAQQGPPKPGESPVSKPVAATSAPLVFEQYHMRVRIEPDGTGTREIAWRIRVNDDVGVRQAGQIPFNYAPSAESLTLTKMEVRKADGRTIPVGADAVQDHAIQPFAGSTTFFDLRQKMITVPSLQPGDRIALVATWAIERPLVAKESWFETSFIKDRIVDDERLEIDVPEAYPIIVRTAATAPAEEQGGKGQLASGRRIYRWKSSNATLPVEDEDAEEPDEAPPADVRITSFDDWNALTDWFRPLLHPAADATVRAKALELTKAIPERDGKIRALYDYVATQIRYVSLSFGLGRFAPHAPADVLTNRYGDCKDKHALLAAMLDAIGVRAVGVLVNTTRSVSDDMPSPAEFNHVITAIPTSEDASTWLWLDTTAEIAPAGLLVPSIRDKQVLFLGPRAGLHRLVKTPADGPSPFVVETNIDGEVNPLGVLVARIRVTARGDVELVMRSLARALPRTELDEYGKGFFKALGFKGEVSDLKMSDPLATGDPYEMSAIVRVGGFLDWAAAKSSLVTHGVGIDIGGLDAVKKDQAAGTPNREVVRYRVKLPAGYIAVAPPGVTLQNDGFEYRSTYSTQDQSISIERTFVRKVRKLEARQAPQYSAMARTITSDFAQGFAVASERKGVPSVPADMTAGELYSAGYSAYNAEDYNTAATLWKRASELDPKMSSAWSGLGFAYQKLKRYDDAIAAMEKQIELDPANKRIHTDLGFVAKTAGKLDVAARAYAKHVEMNPLDGPAYKLLGEIHIDRDDFASAIPVLEKAAALEKTDDWILVLLGAAHLRQGDLRRANEAFDRATAMKGSPATWTRIAWELASKGAEPAKVSALLDRASKQIMESTASLAAGDITDAHIDSMRRLGWIWDARGMLAMKKKDVAAAIRHFEAAWAFLNEIEVVEHLGEAYEAAPNRSSDALNAYLVARSYPRQEGTRLDERIRRLAPNLDIQAVMKAAGRQFIEQRAVVVQGDWGKQTKADLTAILDASGKVIDVRWTSGDEQVRELPAKLMGLKFPIEAPGPEPVRLAVKLRALCTPPLGCGVLMLPPVEAR